MVSREYKQKAIDDTVAAIADLKQRWVKSTDDDERGNLAFMISVGEQQVIELELDLVG